MKSLTTHFRGIRSGAKKFEIRRDDREGKFQIGDELLMREFDQDRQDYTGDSVTVEVTYIMRGKPTNPIAVGYCVMAIKLKR